MGRGYGIALLLLAACSTGRSWSTGEQSEEELRKVLARRDVREIAIALNEAVYLVPAAQLTAERERLLAALAGAGANHEPPPHPVTVETRDRVLAWPRAEVMEFAFDDGLLHVARLHEGLFRVSFEQGRETRWVDFESSAAIEGAWRSLADAARSRAKRETGRSWSDHPLRQLRSIGID